MDGEKRKHVLNIGDNAGNTRMLLEGEKRRHVLHLRETSGGRAEAVFRCDTVRFYNYRLRLRRSGPTVPSGVEGPPINGWVHNDMLPVLNRKQHRHKALMGGNSAKSSVHD